MARLQTAIAERSPPAWEPPAAPLVAGCFVCFPRGEHGPGAAGDPAVAAAVVLQGGRVVGTRIVHGAAGAAYTPGLLALREGPLLAEGAWPADTAGAASPLRIEGEVVGCWLRTRSGARPLAVHAGWRTTARTACDILRPLCHVRTPEPLRQARRLARAERSSPAVG